MAQTAKQWMTPKATIPPQIVNLDPYANHFMHSVLQFQKDQYLLATHILQNYVPSEDRNNRTPTNLRTNCLFLSEMQERGFVDFSPLLEKAPFLKGLTLQLIEPANLPHFLKTYPSLHFIQDLILYPTRIQTHKFIGKAEINHYFPDIYSETIKSAPKVFFISSMFKKARQKVLGAMKDEEWVQTLKQQLLALLHRTPNLQKLIIKDDAFFVPDLEGLQANSLPKLKLLEIDSGLLTPRSIQLLLEAAPNLQELIIPNSELYFDELFLGLKPNSLPHLERIILPRSLVAAANSETLGNFDSKNIEAIQAAAPNLTEMKTGVWQNFRINYTAPPQELEANPEDDNDLFEELVMDDFEEN